MSGLGMQVVGGTALSSLRSELASYRAPAAAVVKYLVAPDIDLCAFEGHFLSVFQSGIFAAAEISRKLPLGIEWDQPNPIFCLCVSRLPEDTRIMSYVRFWAKDLPVAYPPFHP